MKQKKNLLSKGIIENRRTVQLVIGLSMVALVYYFHISLLYLIGVGALTGIVFGKVFCRWMCPMGFIMELMMGSAGDARNQQLYNYHKLGCPIAWISGFLNRFSIVKIKRDASLCIDCGKCDKACYIATLNKDYSLYKESKKEASSQYSCSKCLECVATCPTNSLQYRV